MTARLDHQQLPALFNNSEKFGQERSGIRHFMDDRRGKNEIRRIGKIVNIQSLTLAYPRLNTVQNILLLGSPVKFLDHPLLKVDTYDPAAGTYHFRHGDAEETHGAAHIHNCHSRPDVGGQLVDGVFKQLPEGACQEISNPYGAKMFSQNMPFCEFRTKIRVSSDHRVYSD